MILTGLFRKIKWIIILVVIVTIVYWIIRLWKWKPLLKEMINKEVNLAEAVSRFRKDQPSAGPPKESTRTSDEQKDVDFDYLSRRLNDFMSGPPRRKVRGPKEDVTDEEDETENADPNEEEPEREHQGRDQIRRSNSKVSKFKREEICRKVFEDYFDDYFPTCRPRFLINPKTGHPLELDGYNPRLNLAWEHQGVQHRKYPNPFHKSEEEFNAQVEKDQFKRERLSELGIDLIEIWDDVPTNQVKSFILSEIKRLGK